jgi:hypothetical protein
MIVELRRYLLHPGRRDDLIDLFDREFVETQEAEGMAIIGQFRNLDDPDEFVWIRAFPDMASRPAALTAFYTGPAWKAFGARANETMVSVDNVLLLTTAALPSGSRTGPAGTILAILDPRVRPTPPPGLPVLAALEPAYAENNFPALPVRTDIHPHVWLARFSDVSAMDGWLAYAPPGPTYLRLEPTTRSGLR